MAWLIPNRLSCALLVPLLVLSAAACAQGGGEAATAKPVAPAVQAAADPAAQLKRGKLLYIQCRACHELKAAGGNKVGPHLGDVIGRKAGVVPGFAFSAALKGSNLTWDVATLDRWLVKPAAVVPGNTMAFAGIANAKDRAALIAYLAVETKSK
jgi:cytochrome c